MTLEEDRLHQRLGGSQASAVRPLVALLALSLDYSADLEDLQAAADCVLRVVTDLQAATSQLLAAQRGGGRP